MKSIFPEHFKKSPEELKELWGNSLIALDTNVLIHMYRYSRETKESLYEALTQNKERLWIPNWVGVEFFRQRLDRIGEHANTYEVTMKSLDSIVDKFKSDRLHPFLKQDTLTELCAVVDKAKIELNASLAVQEDLLHNDPVLNELNDLIGDKVGSAYTPKELEEIAKQAEQRYKEDIPPGWADKNKPKDPTHPLKAYGDYIIWRQLLDKAKKDNTNIILISDDVKVDWIQEKRGKKLGPLPALLKEFWVETGQTFYMYSAERFVIYHNEVAETKVDKSVLKELRAYQELKGSEVADGSFLTNIPNHDESKRRQRRYPHFLIAKTLHGEYSWVFKGFNDSSLLVSNYSFKALPYCVDNLLTVRDAVTEMFAITLSHNTNGSYTVQILDDSGLALCRSFISGFELTAIQDAREVVATFLPTCDVYIENPDGTVRLMKM